MLKIARIAPLCLALAACASTPADPPLKPTAIVRGVDSSVRQVVDNYYSVEPDCSNPGYPEVRITRSPAHGTVSVDKGTAYPGFAKDNVRYDCNKTKVAATQVWYESAAGFHGKDSFEVQVRFANSTLRLISYSVDVL